MPNVVEPLEPRRHLSAGDLDSSFGAGGTVTLRNGAVPASGTPDTQVTQLTLDHAGRTLVVSSSYTATQPEYAARPAAYVLTRLSPDGRPDARFALPTGGSIGLNSDESPSKILVDSQDRIYVVSENYVRRYTASGKIDRSYGQRGAAEMYNFFSRTVDATLTADDVLWVVGTIIDNEGPDLPYTYMVRFAPDGRHSREVEPAYDVNYPATPGNAFSVETGPGLLRTLSDGSVVAAIDASMDVTPEDGSDTVSESAVVAFKFEPNGRLDRTYGKNGRTAYRRIESPHVRDGVNDSEVLLVGITNDGVVLIHDKPEGGTARQVALTPAGRQGGVVSFGSTPLPVANVNRFDVHTQSDGRRLVFDTEEHTVTRYDPNGTRDTTFNHNAPFKGVTAIAFGPGNTLLIADTGRSGTDSRFVVRRIEL